MNGFAGLNGFLGLSYASGHHQFTEPPGRASMPGGDARMPRFWTRPNLGFDPDSRPGWILGARALKPKMIKIKPLKPANSGVKGGLGRVWGG